VAAVIYLDTHVVVWLYAGDLELLPHGVRDLLEGEELVISPMVELELQYLYESGRTSQPGRVVVDALDEEIQALDAELTERYGMTAAQLMALRQAAGVERALHARPLASLFFLLRQDVATALRLRRSPVQGHGAAARQRRALVQQRQRVERRRAFLRHTESLFGYWHAIHKPFAILLFLMLAVHIGVAVWLGYAWAW
jgi:PIN domain nuclease of toxin-antitoxin system